MRIICATVLVLLTGRLADLSAQATDPADRATADRVAGEIVSRYSAGISRAEWRRQVPSATWRDRRGSLEAPSESTLPQQPGLWCSSATDTNGAITREVVFYGLRTERPYDCRFEQVRYVVEARPRGGEYDALAQAIGSALGAALGDGGRATSSVLAAQQPEAMDAGDWSMIHTAYPFHRWRDVQSWRTTRQTIFLYRLDATVQVLARTSILTVALRQEQQGYSSDLRYGVDLATWDLVNRLRPVDPEAADQLLDNVSVPQQDRLESVVLRLLRLRARTPRASDRAMLTTVLSMLATRLRVEGDRPADARPSLRPLLALGVTMTESATDAGIWYGSYDPAGTAAPPADPDGTFEYRTVIESDLARLRAHPARVSPGLLLDLAQAYETWWSLSLAPDDEEMLTPSEHAPGADVAWREAIKWYERVISQFPYSREADRARRVIIQLRLGIDTGQRLYFSPYA